ncbi:MAG: 23S rRNA (pseudouridine(1915)-N(3))-methyltransferase RlmH [Alphaproteobacteria bacterium]
MRVSIVAVGRLRAGPMRTLFQDYATRFEQLGRGMGVVGIKMREVAEAANARPADRRKAEAKALLPPDRPMRLVVLDEGGRDVSSTGLADFVRDQRDEGTGEICFIIGGPDGLDKSVVNRADLVLGFGRQTWPHQLVRVMLAEQLYRALTILSNHPYHRS